MTEREVGVITQEECDEIKGHYQRLQVLKEMFGMLAAKEDNSGGALYETMVRDKMETNERYSGWFQTKAKKYGWKSGKGDSWRVDFTSRKVFLVSG